MGIAQVWITQNYELNKVNLGQTWVGSMEP